MGLYAPLALYKHIQCPEECCGGTLTNLTGQFCHAIRASMLRYRQDVPRLLVFLHITTRATRLARHQLRTTRFRFSDSALCPMKRPVRVLSFLVPSHLPYIGKMVLLIPKNIMSSPAIQPLAILPYNKALGQPIKDYTVPEAKSSLGPPELWIVSSRSQPLMADLSRLVSTQLRTRRTNHFFCLCLLNDWSARDIQGLQMNSLGSSNEEEFPRLASALGSHAGSPGAI
jgi:hypothetical protein